MALGGWKSPAMLSRYAHLSPAHLWKAVEGLTHLENRDQNREQGNQWTTKATKALENYGEPAGTRTQGPRLKRAMLYRLSYRLTVRMRRTWGMGVSCALVTWMSVAPCVGFRFEGANGLRNIMVSWRLEPVEIMSMRHSASSSIRFRYCFASRGNVA